MTRGLASSASSAGRAAADNAGRAAADNASVSDAEVVPRTFARLWPTPVPGLLGSDVYSRTPVRTFSDSHWSKTDGACGCRASGETGEPPSSSQGESFFRGACEAGRPCKDPIQNTCSPHGGCWGERAPGWACRAPPGTCAARPVGHLAAMFE